MYYSPFFFFTNRGCLLLAKTFDALVDDRPFTEADLIPLNDLVGAWRRWICCGHDDRQYDNRCNSTSCDDYGVSTMQTLTII